MELLDFKNKMKPLNKADVVKLINNHRDFTEGAYDNLRLLTSENISLSEAIGGWKMAPALFQAMRGNIPKSIKMESILEGAIKNVLLIIDVIEKDVKSGPSVIAKETATVKEVNALMLDSYISFWVDYLARLMNMFTSMMIHKKSAEQVAQKPDLEFLTQNLERFGELTYMFFERGGVVLKRYRSAPKIVADEQTVDVLTATKGKDAVLVMPTRNFGPHSLNPGYWWSMYQMERALSQYEAMQNSIESNAQKISYYRDLQNQDPSPANEKMIEKLEGRIISAQAKMEAIEQSYS
ncbi:hypothetical protein HWC35_gp089 [Vibrio phage USC-1]|uniref:Virion structural protein n=2 Tax=Aphroditevirus USC1 TaxID=2846605 RepID=A0A514A2I7_9CAUD|nr:hypothetical protein HWC35_gp089 [Vibrio phage USC-1]QCW23245.1 hypothetical protein [Vibrio phage 5 TSL-2019]QDH47483.1 hypothetical protein [Vibrio phage USC-1]